MIPALIGIVLLLFIVLIYFICIIFGLNTSKIVGGLDTIQTNSNYFNTISNPLKKVISQPVASIKYYDEIPSREPYNNSKILRHTKHIGQLKLALTEIEFLTQCLSNNDEAGILVYAGSAPSNHISLVAELFPNMKFVLIDPNEHVIMFYEDKIHTTHYNNHQDQVVYFRKQNNKNKFNGDYFDSTRNVIANVEQALKDLNYTNIVEFIKTSQHKYYILEDLFTDDFAKALGGLKFYFCSDIRTNTGKTDFEDFPSDMDILWNNAQQYVWLNLMNPIKCMLKFRCPFMNTKEVIKDDEMFAKSRELGIDFIADYNKGIFNYLTPENIYIQAFPGVSSTESRFVTSDYKSIQAMDPKEYEDKFFYYNRFERLFGYHDNAEYFDYKIGIDACGDCDLMIHIYKDYYEKYFTNDTSPASIKKSIDYATKVIQRSLIKDGYLHGFFHKPYTNVEQIKQQQQEYMKYNLYRSKLRDLVKAQPKQ